jgi:hypothetical protein
MAIKALNSVGGFSVGENLLTVILSNGDITTGNANLTGNVFANNVLTDNYRYANGDPVDFQLPAGNLYEIQFNSFGDFGASPDLIFTPANATLLLNGSVQSNTIVTVSTISAGGNVTAPFFLGNVIGNISGNIVVPGTNTSVLYNDSGNAGSSDAFQFNEVSNVLTLTGNFSVQNISNANLIEANYFNGTLITANQPNITSVGNLTSLTVLGNIDAPNINVSSNLSVTSNITASNLSLTGNANIFRLTASNLQYPNVDGSVNQVLVTDGNGILGFADANNHFIANGTSNVFVNSNSNITISSNNVSNVVVISDTGLYVTGLANISGNIDVANLTTSGLISATGNVVGNNFTGNTLSVVGNVNGSNITTNGLTSTGNLSITGFVEGNLIPGSNNSSNLGTAGQTWGNVYVGNSIYIGNASLTESNGNIVISNIDLQGNTVVSTLSVTGNTFNQGDVLVSGNLTVNGNTTYINVTDLAIKDPLILLGGNANGANIGAYDGKDRGLILHNYYSNGSGPYNQAFIWKTANLEFQAISNVTDFTNEIVSSNGLANIRGNAFIGNLQGTVLQASQTNITTVGTLTSLSVTGNIDTANRANVGSLQAANLLYPVADGTANQVLATYGNGVLFFNTISTSSLTNGNSNVVVNANSNVTISANGVANVVTITSVGGNVTGNLSVSANTSANNFSANYNINIGNTALSWATITTTSTAANQIITSLDANVIRGAEFLVKGEEITGGKYTVVSLSGIHNGTSANYAVYSSVNMGGQVGQLRVIYSSGLLSLAVTPATSNSTVWTTQYRMI